MAVDVQARSARGPGVTPLLASVPRGPRMISDRSLSKPTPPPPPPPPDALSCQVLLAEMAALLPKSCGKPNMRHADVYVKAFYVPEGEMLHWVQTHREYTPKQLLALVKLVGEAAKWKKEGLTKLLAEVEMELQ